MDRLPLIAPLLIGWVLDLIFGDPQRIPHLIVYFGRMVALTEKILNRGSFKIARGAAMTIILVGLVAFVTWEIEYLIREMTWAEIIFQSIIIYYCLAGTTLIREVRMVFEAADRSLDEGRRQVSRIVGRDTAALTDDEVRTAALETLAENLNDGVIAPLFWYMCLGLPGMVAYKMINTLDSMVGYRNDRYILFGRIAARLDDVAGYIPARLTALLMVIASGRLSLLSFVRRFGQSHASPNSGYPEAALAGILDCRFGGTHDYFGVAVVKPYIGENQRQLTTADMQTAVVINRRAETMMVAATLLVRWLLW